MRTNRTLSLLCLLCMFLTNVAVHAQSEDDQLLIFRNTGETNLFYQSEIDSITFTKVDTLGIEHDEPIAQIFHTADTTLYVSIAEIDSVCFGSRNEIEYRNDVRVLDDALDMQWIIRYDGECIYYKTTTPSNVLPSVGQKLYFSEQTELFPYGLCAKVNAVTHGNDEIAVSVSYVEYTEVFKKFFYAGSLDGVRPAMARALRNKALDINTHIGLDLSWKIDSVGSFSAKGGIGVNGKVVMNPWKKYYHADIDIFSDVEFHLKATLKSAGTKDVVFKGPHIPLPVVAGIFQPSFDADLFFDVKGELAFEDAWKRASTTRISWTRRGDEHSFERRNPTDEGQQKNEFKTQVTLNGTLYLGIRFDFNFALVGDIAGAKARAKLGPEYYGELSIGLLHDMSESYDASLYMKAKLGIKAKFLFEGLLTRREKWFGSTTKELKFFDHSYVWDPKIIDLFPKFSLTRAVASLAHSEVSVAVKSDNQIAYPVETGFQVLTERPDTVHEVTPVKEVFVKDIEAKEEPVIQGVDTIITLPETIANADTILVRPVFHYAGYTIPHATVNAAQDPNIQPVIFCMTNGAATIVSGVPIVGNVKIDSTTYNIGPFLMNTHYDKVFHKKSPYAGIGGSFGYAYQEDEQMLYGTWTGDIDGENITIKFSQDDTCEYSYDTVKLTDAKWQINEPQSGYILIEGANTNIVLEILSVEEDSISVKFKTSDLKGKVCHLSRQ